MTTSASDAATGGTAEALPTALLCRIDMLEARSAKLIEDSEREHRGFDARLILLEQAVPASSVVGPWYTRVPWEQIPSWLQAIATPLMVAAVGWWLTGSLDLAIKQQQADISGVKEMREALKDLYAAEPEKSALDTAALSIAAFGGVAAGPLIEAINRGGAARMSAAQQGLVAAAALDKERVCRVLAATADASHALYPDETRKIAKELRGDLRC
jgi:hypothetical protein